MVMPEGGQALVTAHIAFNASLFLLALPFCRAIEAPPVRGLLPDPDTSEALTPPDSLRPASALDMTQVTNPSQALACLKREVLRMGDLVEAMFRPTLDLYRTGTKEEIAHLRDMDDEVNACLSGIRDYVAALPIEHYSKADAKHARDLMEYAIRLETAGDVASKRLTTLAERMRRKGTAFSKEGRGELTRMHDCILSNMRLASNILISDDLESARLLSLEKTEVKRAERDSRKRHLKRLQQGAVDSFETSDIHLETLRAFREFNSHIAAVAYPILYRNGQLLETRLIEDMDGAATKS